MLYGVLADFVVMVHFAFVLFVVLGGFRRILRPEVEAVCLVTRSGGSVGCTH